MFSTKTLVSLHTLVDPNFQIPKISSPRSPPLTKPTKNAAYFMPTVKMTGTVKIITVDNNSVAFFAELAKGKPHFVGWLNFASRAESGNSTHRDITFVINVLLYNIHLICIDFDAYHLKARKNAFLEAVFIASRSGICALILSAAGSPFPSFFGALFALNTSITDFIGFTKIKPSVYRSMVLINSLFSFYTMLSPYY